jgi:hypothetical protein
MGDLTEDEFDCPLDADIEGLAVETDGLEAALLARFLACRR